ncbi:MAG: hypothetical protein AB1758_06150, partial [Candidatus Eremiobacterota bacterium]
SLVPVFKALTDLYTPQLNMTLGENLYLQSDWWFFGDGTVPVFPKLDPVRMATAVTGLKMPTIPSVDWGTLIRTHYDQALRGAASKILTKVIGQIMAKIIGAAMIPFGGVAVDMVIDMVMDDIEKEIDKMMGYSGVFDSLPEDALNFLKNQVKTAANGVMADGILRELSGCLVYSGGTLFIGYENATPIAAQPLMASGLFVAKEDVRIAADYTVGAVVSLEGYIDCKNLLYNPYFSKASIYVPKASKLDWVERAFEVEYGPKYASNQATDVSAALPKAFTVRGWNR